MSGNILQLPVLVLNANFAPLNVCHLRRALGLVLEGISSTAFMYEIGRRGLCINYTAEDALTDVETVRQRLGR